MHQRHTNSENGSSKDNPSPKNDATAGPTVGSYASASWFNRSIFVLAFIMLVCAVFLSHGETPLAHPLPNSYAVCSRTGAAIYTVDEAGSLVQCMAIHDSHIIATGSLGKKCILICKHPNLMRSLSRSEGNVGQFLFQYP